MVTCDDDFKIKCALKSFTGPAEFRSGSCYGWSLRPSLDPYSGFGSGQALELSSWASYIQGGPKNCTKLMTP